MQGTCPVCGTSWMWITNKYNYFCFLRKQFPESPTDLLWRQAQSIKDCELHLSALEHYVEEEIHRCPVCKTKIKIIDYQYKELKTEQK